MPIDGRTLWPWVTGEWVLDPDEDGEAVAEYCAECAPASPIFMLRQGRWKYIHCDVDPPQLFDVVADPHELENLIGLPDYAQIASDMAADIAKRWDSDAIRANVIATQKQRRAIHAAMEAGLLTSWDYQPKGDASQEFVRNHMDWTEAAEKTRFPPFSRDS